MPSLDLIMKWREGPIELKLNSNPLVQLYNLISESITKQYNMTPSKTNIERQAYGNWKNVEFQSQITDLIYSFAVYKLFMKAIIN